jgi:FkbM family methyltransferase
MPDTLFTHAVLTLWTRDNDYALYDQHIVQQVQREYFWETLRDFPVKTIVDVGAHIGAFTLYAKHVWQDAHIIAVEVEADNARLLLKNTAEMPGVFAYHACVGYTTDDKLLAKSRRNSGNHIVHHRGKLPTAEWVIGDYDTQAITAPVFTLETLMQMQQFASLDLLKLDCEGCESDILQHVSEAVLVKTRCIVGERHLPKDDFLQKIGGRLAQFDMHFADTAAPSLGHFLLMNKTHPG